MSSTPEGQIDTSDEEICVDECSSEEEEEEEDDTSEDISYKQSLRYASAASLSSQDNVNVPRSHSPKRSPKSHSSQSHSLQHIKEHKVTIGSDRSAFTRPKESGYQTNPPRSLINMDLVTNPMLRPLDLTSTSLLDQHRMQLHWYHMARMQPSLDHRLGFPYPYGVLPPHNLNSFNINQFVAPPSHLIHQRTHGLRSGPCCTSVSEMGETKPQCIPNRSTCNAGPHTTPTRDQTKESPSSSLSTSLSNSSTSPLDLSPSHSTNRIAGIGHASRTPHPGFPGYGTLGFGGRRPRDPNKPPALKKYKCDICCKAFSRSNTLVTHRVSYISLSLSRHPKIKIKMASLSSFRAATHSYSPKITHSCFSLVTYT